MADPVSGRAQVKYVRQFFEQEKLPFDLGWRPSPAPITLVSLGAMIVQLVASGPDPVAEGAQIVT